MRRLSILALGAALFASVAFAAVVKKTDIITLFKTGVIIGNVGTLIDDSYAGSATIDFAATSVGVVESSGITVTGAAVNDTCEVGVPAAAGALAARYECYVSAANTVVVKFTPLSESFGTTAALNGASPSVITATVIAGSVCTCSLNGNTAAIAAGGCAVGVSSTTLTITSANSATATVNYYCRAPVDPASGTYTVRVFDP